eukprot:scaffold962_cov372-Prasinococcus_capsulatus_cf.AAC.10
MNQEGSILTNDPARVAIRMIHDEDDDDANYHHHHHHESWLVIHGGERGASCRRLEACDNSQGTGRGCGIISSTTVLAPGGDAGVPPAQQCS